MTTARYGVRPHFWRVMGGAAVVGLLAGAACVVYLAVEHVVTRLLWGEGGTPLGLFTGSLVGVLVVLAAGALVGWVRHRTGLTGPDPDFIAEMIEGEVPLRRGARYGLLGLISLVGGGSVGPEAPLGTLGGGIGTAVGRRYERREEATQDLTFAGISGVFGALGTFPFAGPIMAWEVHHDRWHEAPHRMLPGIVSATTALAVLYPLLGTPFLSVYDLGDSDLRVWWIGLAAVLGVAGAALGAVCVLAMTLSRRWSARVPHVVVRALVGAAVVAAVGYAVPLTLFSGRAQLSGVLEGGVAVTAGLLVLVLLGKVLTFVVSMTWGFFGGPIFPLVFVGAVAGVLVHQVVPGIPLVVAVPALAASVTAALVPLPLMVMVITTMLFGLQLELGVVPAVAVVTSTVLVRGTGLAAWLSGPSRPTGTTARGNEQRPGR
ncbi:chloride channel protein [uncultured Serinicoccus sp.]|uniref:chloride channel protein n=1 Tax=uncultured Serinicoccus sp. TaxID=735514 RepID=UPI00261279EA|nr:chloride channel protein [uncultured Serinicoccus sp.]